MSTKDLRIKKRVVPKNEIDAVALALDYDFLNKSYYNKRCREQDYAAARARAVKVIAALDAFRSRNI